MALEFGWAPLSTLLAQGLEDLAVQNWEEVEPAKDDLPLAIDWDHLLAQEKLGVYRIIAARADGELVGYDSFFLNRHYRHRHSTVAMGSVIWLAPEHRRWVNGLKMIRAGDRLVAAAGAQRIDRGEQVHVKLGHSRGTLGDILLKMGYVHTENRYSKIIK